MAPSSFCVSAPGRGQPTADPGGGELMVVVGGAIPAAPPDGTVQPGLGRGTSLGVGGQTICTFFAERGQCPPGSRPGPGSSAGFGASRLVSPACSLPRVPRAARMHRPPCAPLSPPALVGPGRRLGCLRAGRRLAGGCPPAGTRAGGAGARGRGLSCGYPGPRFPAAPPAKVWGLPLRVGLQTRWRAG